MEMEELPKKKIGGTNRLNSRDSVYSTSPSIISTISESRKSVRSTSTRNDGTGEIEGKEMQNTIVLSLSFFLVFTAYLAVQNLQSSLNEEHNLGVISLSCLYGAIIFSGILAPTIIRLVGVKWSLVLSWVSHCIYTAANFYPHWASLIPASILLGLVSGPLWTSQSIYISACSYSYARTSEKTPYQVLTQMNGIFFTIYETTQITGNLVSSLVLRQDVDNDTFVNLTKFCGYQDCPTSANSTDLEEPEAATMYTLLGVFLGCDVVGLLVTLIFLTPLPKSDWSSHQSVGSTLTSCFVTLFRSELLLLVPLIMFMATEQAVLLSDYTKAYISCPIGIHNVGFVMACYGGATAIMAFVFSRVAKFTGRQILLLFASAIDLAGLLVLYHWIPSPDHKLYIFLLPVFWGIAEGIWQTQSNSLIALLFWDKKEPAFANYHTWKAVGFTLTFVYGTALCQHVRLLVALALLAVAVAGYLTAEIYLGCKERRALHKNAESES